MIRALLVGMARTIFGLACVALVVGGLLVWFSFRLLRRSFRAEDAPADTRTALFAVLLALVALARTVGAKVPAYDARQSKLAYTPMGGAPDDRPVE